MTEKYDVCILGLGPVGAVSGLCFAKLGLRVIGVDIDQRRVSMLAKGEVPFVEPGLEELCKEMVRSRRFHATVYMREAVQNAPVILIAVGTPTPKDAPDLSQLDKVCEQIGALLKDKSDPTVIAVRSTVPPGTIRNRLIPIIEGVSHKRAGIGFHMASNPEFLREGTAIRDFFHTSRVIVGADSDYAAACIDMLYKGVEADERLRVSIESAEFAKYIDNTWHALKVSFANEIGRVCHALGGDAAEMTRIFLSDKRLNISECYLKPGFAFGGSCLPKDVRGLAYLARSKDVNIPVIDAILPSNEAHIALGVEAILEQHPLRVGILGIAFKDQVDDVRESPALAVANGLIEHNINISVTAHDPAYSAGHAVLLPHSGKTLNLTDIQSLTQVSDVLVIMHNLPLYRTTAENFLRSGKAVIDLTGLPRTDAPLLEEVLQFA